MKKLPKQHRELDPSPFVAAFVTPHWRDRLDMHVGTVARSLFDAGMAYGASLAVARCRSSFRSRIRTRSAK